MFNPMARVLQPIAACFKKAGAPETIDEKEKNSCEHSENNDEIKKMEVEKPGVIWRMSSGLYNIGSGAVGLGVGSVKWAASTTYTVGSGVVSATQTVVSKVIPSAVPKPKKE